MKELKIYGFILLIGISIGLGVGYKMFNRPEQPTPASVKLDDKSQEKKSGIIKKFAPPTAPGGEPILVEIEEYKSDIKKDIESDSVAVPPDNLMFDTDFKTEIGGKWKPFDNIPFLNKVWIGPEYNFQHNEIKLKAGFSTRLNL